MPVRARNTLASCRGLKIMLQAGGNSVRLTDYANLAAAYKCRPGTLVLRFSLPYRLTRTGVPMT